MKKLFTAVLAALLALAFTLPLAGCTSKLDQYLDLGVRYLSEENYEEAILAFTSAIEIEPKCVAAYEGRGDAYAALGDYAAAIADYTAAIEIEPLSVTAYEGRGDAYAALGDYEAAAADYRAAIELAEGEQLAALRKKLEDVYLAQAAGLLRQGQLDEALALLDSADANELLPQLCAEVGHTPTPANYRQPETCTVCGAQVGEPLPADFETYGLTAHLVQPGIEYDYHTVDDTNTHSVVGKARFSPCRIFASDGTHEAKEGYEWRIVDITVVFGDGCRLHSSVNDYYNITAFHDSVVRDDSVAGASLSGSFTVNWNGVDYPECRCTLFKESSDWSSKPDPAYPDWSMVCIYTIRIEVLVPTGYDGIVLGLGNSGVKRDGYLHEQDNSDSLFFRMA